MKPFPLLISAIFLLQSCGAEVDYKTSPQGGITELTIASDTTGMDWILCPDGSQYSWVDARYQWGLGTLKVNGNLCEWTQAVKAGRGGAEFDISDALSLSVTRRKVKGDLIETYTFRNEGSEPLQLSEIDVNTPFNDNYPDAQTCLRGRCHAHIWAAGTAGYVCAVRMGAEGPHLGLMITEGSLEGYSVKERSREKGMSNYRGVICLSPAAATLGPGEEYRFSWRLFTHEGWEDFFSQIIERGGVRCSADRYVAQLGESVRIYRSYNDASGREVTDSLDYTVSECGDVRVPLEWNGGETYVELLGVSSYENILSKRADFIIDHQQFNCKGDPRDGAILPYDNRSETQYHEWEQPENWSDANEGRERVGSAIFLAYLAQRNPSDKLLHALDRYCSFVRNNLQDSNFDTWSDVGKSRSRIAQASQRMRIYNYPWVAHLYCQMFELTGDRKYLEWAYGTQMSCYRNGGYNFYFIDMPVEQSIRLMKENDMAQQADTLLGEYRRGAEHYLENGLNYPKSEVNYEQSIVAPSAGFLCEMYLVTGEKRYLDAVSKMMPVLEAFGGKQPSSHLNDISIRHWDGYWFGLPRTWGDTLPHYWSCITADTFADYSRCIRDTDHEAADAYMARARSIILQNLSLFTEEGRGGAAFLYPDRVNGEPVHGLSAFANDQDFALMYFLKWDCSQ